jgi:hypothetical protein
MAWSIKSRPYRERLDILVHCAGVFEHGLLAVPGRTATPGVASLYELDFSPKSPAAGGHRKRRRQRAVPSIDGRGHGRQHQTNAQIGLSLEAPFKRDEDQCTGRT